MFFPREAWSARATKYSVWRPGCLGDGAKYPGDVT